MAPRAVTQYGYSRLAWRVLAAVLLALGLYALLGYLALPRLAHEPLERTLSEELARPVTIGRLEFDPFLLRLRVHELSVADAGEAGIAGQGAEAGIAGQAGGELAGFDRLEVDVSSRSLLRLAPVISSLRLEQPRVRVRRDAEGGYNVSDLLRKWSAPSAEAQEPSQPQRFAVTNIEVDGGRFTFDDALQGARHEVASLTLRLPFVSSLPVDEAVYVEPHLSATVDGAPMQLDVRALPFRSPQDWVADIDLEPIDLVRFAAYLPDPPVVELQSGRLGGTLRITVAQPDDAPPAVSVVGRSTLSDFSIAEPGGAPLFAAASIDVDGIEVTWPQNRHSIARITVDAPQASVRRRGDGSRFLEPVLAALERHDRTAAPARGPDAATDAGDAAASPDDDTHPPGNDAASSVALWRIDELIVKAGQLAFVDEAFEPRPLQLAAKDIEATVQAIGSDAGQPAKFEASLALADGEKLRASGTTTWQTGAVDTTLALADVSLARWWWIVEPHLAIDAIGGALALDARLRIVPVDGAASSVRIDDGALRLREVAMRQRWDRRTLLALPQLDVEGVRVDVGARNAELASVRTRGGKLLVRREADARLNVERIAAPGDDAAGVAAKGDGAQGETRSTPWVFSVARLGIEGFALDVEDETAGKAANLQVDEVAFDATGLSSATGAKPAAVSLRARIDRRGSLQAQGQLALDPVDTSLRVAARGLPIVALQPYFTEYVDAIVSRGAAGFEGDLRVALAADAPPLLTYRGSASVADFAAVTKRGNRDLLAWKSLAVDGIDYASAPATIVLGGIAVSGLRSRLIISREGRFNLQDVFVDRDSPAVDDGVPRTAGAAKETPAPVVRIGGVRLTDGNIDFSDFFIRPNYSANLTGLRGGISRIERDRPGDIELRGRIDQTGSVTIRGQINPLADTLFLDIRAGATDIDLPRLSPYSSKYVGYGIEKGKLSANVEYKVVDRELTGKNEIVLDQLTFGEKVESPDALNLPVLFAVALLKDRNGVIDVSLPIGGSLDDPQFSIGGIVLRLIGNLIVKAVTAPFALIANLAGAGGEELSWLGFDAGSAQIGPDTKEKMAAIAKALAERPGLKLDVSGRADPTSDREALRERSLERALKQRKARDIGAGTDPEALAAITIEADEYAKYLEEEYRAARFERPRNRIGMLEKQPPERMKAMLLEHVQVGDARLARLADDRAQQVKESLVESGIAGERIFVVAPKIDGAAPVDGKPDGKPEAKDKAPAPGSRVDLSLK